MAAGDFSASVANRVNIALNQMFVDPITQKEFNLPFDTTRALLGAQKARSTEVLEGSKCVGVKAYFIKAANALNVSVSSDCTVPAGTELESSSKNFTSGVLAATSVQIDDDLCDNELTFVELSAAGIRKSLNDLRQYLNNTVIIPALTAGAQANLDSGIHSDWDATTNSPRIDVPESFFGWEYLGEFKAVAENNNFGSDFLFLSGRNFYQDFFNKNYNVTDTRVDGAAAPFNDHNMFFDIRHLDATLSRKSTFAIDTGSYIFWNTVINTPTPMQIQERRWVYTIQDPTLVYMRNGVATPVQYEVEYEKACISRESALNYLEYKHTYHIKLLGGFQLAPTGVNSETGILEFSSVAAV